MLRKSIGVNDLHIAGHTVSEGLTLVTNNEQGLDFSNRDCN
jgi:predicted nucleic acid-binding protein